MDDERGLRVRRRITAIHERGIRCLGETLDALAREALHQDPAAIGALELDYYGLKGQVDCPLRCAHLRTGPT